MSSSVRLIHLVMLITAAIALPAMGETLPEIYALAKQSDPKFLAMRSEFEATGFAVKEAQAGLLPTVAYQFSRNRIAQNILESDNAVFAAGQATYPTKEHTLSVTQPIFRLSSWRHWRQSQATERQAGAAYAAAEQDLILRTATAYMAVLAAGDSLTLARGENDAIKRQFDLAEAKFKSGQAIKGNLFEAQARYALKGSDVIAAENELADRIQALRELTGVTSSKLQPLPEKILMPAPDPQSADGWVASALKQNLLLEARFQAVDVARQEITKRKAAYYPTLDLALSRNRRDTGGSLFGGGSNVNTNDIGVRLNIPLVNGGATGAQVGQALKHFETAQQDLERDRRQIERQARAAYQGVVSGMVRVRALEQSVQAFESARSLREEGYKAGVSTMLALLDAERDLYAARRDSAQSRYDFALNSLRLRQAAGTLSEDDLRSVARAAP